MASIHYIPQPPDSQLRKDTTLHTILKPTPLDPSFTARR